MKEYLINIMFILDYFLVIVSIIKSFPYEVLTSNLT